jgi:superfamily II DNA or RNA helicase
MEEQVEKLLSEKGFVKYGYQFDFLINPEFLKPKFPIVYALGTGGGKTYTTIMKIDLFYSDLKNKGKKTVIFPHATNVLKDNFVDAIENYGEKSFTYKVINYTSEIKEIFVSNVDVIIMLPQLVINHLSKLKKVEWLIVDEAHEWYGQKSYKKILKALNPTYQLLLTGTPAKFNRNRSEFLFHYTSVDTLRKLGKLGNARVEIVSSNYNLKREDITTSLNVRKSVVSKNNKSSLEDVCKQMLISLKNPTTLRSKTPNNLFGTVFNSMKKTLIVCNSQKQAKEFYKILNSKIPNKVLISISDDGGDSSEFKIFKQNLDILVLLIVRKGRLGFDMPHLHNIVDFSLTTNIDVISQMLGRVLRKDDNNSLKYYFKVAPQNTVWFYQAIMMVVLRVTMQDAFETYDGDQNKISIPNPKPPKERQSRGQRSESRDPSFKEIATDLIMDMDFFNYINHKGNRSFQTVSYTTLDEVRKECLGIRTGILNCLPMKNV